MIRVEIEYESGIKELWIGHGNPISDVRELLKLDYTLYKEGRKARYYYMGTQIHIKDDLDFIENSRYIKIQMTAIEKIAWKCI